MIVPENVLFALAAAASWGGGDFSGGMGVKAAGRKTMVLAIIGGLGFGFYFVALRMANGLGVMEPIALARAGSLVTCLLLLAIVSLRGKEKVAHKAAPWLSLAAVGWAMGVALLDTGGNLLFIAATRIGRLDVTSVLTSLYPAGTILLAAWYLHERPTRQQIAGMVIALVAVVMVTA